MKKKHIIDFKWLPASWGLVGDVYDEAEAHYNLDGEDLERRLIEIRHRDNPTVRATMINDLDLKNRKIDAYTHDIRQNELEYSDLKERLLNQIQIDVKYGKLLPYDAAVKRIDLVHGNAKTDEEKMARDLAVLEVEYEHNRMEKNAYEKRKATLKNEPWVGFVDTGFDPNDGLDNFRLELDYNQQWIEYLRLHGFVGHTDEQVLEDWFVEVCRTNAQTVDPNVSVFARWNKAEYPYDGSDN